MKSYFAATLVLLALPLCAQTAAAPAPASTPSAPAPTQISSAEAAAMASPLLSTLTPDEKTKLTLLHSQVLDQNPDLKNEEIDLMQKGIAMQASNPGETERQAFIAEARAHAAKVHVAMVKLDPSVEAIFTKITAQSEKLKTQAPAAP